MYYTYMARIVNGVQVIKATSIKNTITYKEDGKIKLKHYKTVILQIDDKTKKIEIIMPVSNASRDAIYQVLNVYGLADKADKACKKLNGVSMLDYWRRYRHAYGGSSRVIDKRYRQEELLSL